MGMDKTIAGELQVNSTRLMLFLCVQYFIIILFAMRERNYPRALYRLCAIGINLAVLWGTMYKLPRSQP